MLRATAAATSESGRVGKAVNQRRLPLDAGPFQLAHDIQGAGGRSSPRSDGTQQVGLENITESGRPTSLPAATIYQPSTGTPVDRGKQRGAAVTRKQLLSWANGV